MKRSYLLCVGVLWLSTVRLYAAGPNNEQLRRGETIRHVLLEALDHANAHYGEWPERLSLPPGAPQLAYKRPVKFEDPDGRVVEEMRGVSVVLHEPLDEARGGAWVGYGDGHLEFAPDAQALEECKAQVRIMRDRITAAGRFNEEPAGHPQTTPDLPAPEGSLELRVVDAEGRPVQGALVGIYGYFGDSDPEQRHVYFPLDREKDQTAITDADGRARLPGPQVFGMSRYATDESASLVISTRVAGWRRWARWGGKSLTARPSARSG